MPIVLGIVIAAVGDALLLEAPAAPASIELVAVQTGGALLFLIGVGLFKRHANTLGNFPMSHIVAVLAFAALGWLARGETMPGLAFAGWGAAILLVTSVWEWVSYHGGWMERADRIGLRVPQVIRERAERRRAEMERRRS